MMDVSVIVPVYNAAEYLEQCIRSICAQTLQSIEIICVDDGSTDGSLEMLKKLAAEDERITVLTQANAGAGAARNHGLQHAKGKYLSFLDADDFFEPNMLEEAFRAAEKDAAELVVFGADFFNHATKQYMPCNYSLRLEMLPCHRPFAGIEIEKDIFKTVVGWAWDKLFLAEFVRKNGLLFQQQRTTNDLLFVFSALAKAERITTVDAVLAHQRTMTDQRLSATREKSWRCFYYALSALRSQLEDWELYGRFEQDFINYALHFSLWNLNTLKPPAQSLLYQKLRKSWFDKLGISGHPASYFYRRGEYAQYIQMLSAPYNRGLQWIAGVIQRGCTWLRRKW